MTDGWKSSGNLISWATKNDELEEYTSLQGGQSIGEAKGTICGQGGQSKMPVVAGLLEQTVTESSNKKQ